MCPWAMGSSTACAQHAHVEKPQKAERQAAELPALQWSTVCFFASSPKPPTETTPLIIRPLPAQQVFIPCGHRAVCAECSKQLLDAKGAARACPICRAHVSDSMLLF